MEDPVTDMWTFEETIDLAITLATRTPTAQQGVTHFTDEVYDQFATIIEYLEVSGSYVLDIPEDWDTHLEQQANQAFGDELLARAEPHPFHTHFRG